jgi:DNA gyrase subunit A
MRTADNDKTSVNQPPHRAVLAATPHGDASVYDALVRLDRTFRCAIHWLMGTATSLHRRALPPPTVYEARMARLSNEMLRDIEKDTIDYVPNYDDSRKEPLVSFPFSELR